LARSSWGRTSLLGHLFARQHAQRLDQAEGDARAMLQAFALFQLDQRFEDGGDMAVE
jgi:hypothetical protein